MAAGDEDANYALGSVLNHVCLHQTVIGQEAMAQIPEEPDVVVGCVGGGSNFSGIAFPTCAACSGARLRTRFVAAEPAACPTLTRGAYRYDFGDTVGMTPLLPMYTLGHDFVPPPVHAGGLRSTATRPCSAASSRPAWSSRAPTARTRPSPPRCVSRAARASSGPRAGPRDPRRDRGGRDRGRQAGEERAILFNLCGHGHFDMSAYDAYLAGTLEDPEFSEEDMNVALGRLPEAPAIA